YNYLLLLAMERFLTGTIKYLLFFVLVVIILVYAKPFLVPVVFSALFSMLLLPLSTRLENRGISRGLSTFICVMLFVVVIAIMVYVLVWQIGEISKNAAEIEQNIQQKVKEAKDYVARTFGISLQKQDQIIREQQKGGGGVMPMVSGMVASLGSFLTDLILSLVYIFLFLYYRTHLKKFVVMLAPAGSKRNAQEIMEQARQVAQKYIAGLAWMIASLWVMYSIGFSIVGVNSPVLFAILCGLLEIVPFVGNLTGNAITALAVVMQGGSLQMVAGVLITYAIVQFLQTYVLEPLVVGKGVSINPLFTIAGIVAGELVWGIPGMILAIPILGITKIICDHIEPLKPIGYLIGSEKESDTTVIEKVKKFIRKKTS
ncbi:MAG TPA: AI-2E family transporter, partial [Flavisolibacter sp.]